MSESDQFEIVYQTDSQAQVMMLKMALGNADIPFMCDNDVVSTVLPFDGMANVRFRVLARDAGRAREILDDLGFE